MSYTKGRATHTSVLCVGLYCAFCSSICRGQADSVLPDVPPPSQAPDLETEPPQSSATPSTQVFPTDSEDTTAGEYGPNMGLGLAVLAFGSLTLVLFSWMTMKGVKLDDNTFKLLALPLILTTALFLIPGGYTAQQVAPLMGLLGTLTGYLLGTTRASRPGVE